MSKTRSKKIVEPVIGREQVDEVAAEYAAADAKIEKITASIDVQLTNIRKKYQPELTLLTAKKEEAFNKLQKFAEAYKEELFPGISEGKAKKKSLETAHGSIGFRTGMPALKPLKGFTWEAITNLLKAFLPEYVKTKTEANREKLLADRDDVMEPKDENDPLYKIPMEERPVVSSLFPKCGIKVEQAEAFFVELKKEDVSNVTE